eukprot:TRINITY_DN10879_c0_g1_i3.p1 TRINITY_DN10879_c0_g1~~TRINITY_DN10879_c0_g1_i3.p1  ORF type:complete len:259 (+),score=33.17 TRINITY_DN10879_c0_g1_i3:114-890(+)
MGASDLAAAQVVFLGDYCDRGNNTREALDLLIALKADRHPERTHFLAGNHDFGFAGFLGCLPADPSSIQAWEQQHAREASSDLPLTMHPMGRKWANGTAFDSAKTFRSYGVPFERELRAHTALCAAVPEAHKQFLRELIWVWECDTGFAPGSVLCVHAGLDSESAMLEQLEALRRRDLCAEVLWDEAGECCSFSGRCGVLGMPGELAGGVLLVSGHHGMTMVEGDRVVVDYGEGKPYLPMEALAVSYTHLTLPTKRIV